VGILHIGVGLHNHDRGKTMNERCQKFWPLFSALLILAILASIFIFPSITRMVSLAVILLGMGISIFLTIQRHRKGQQAGKITPAFMRRAIALDISGLLLTMGVVMFLAAKAGAYTAQAASAAWGGTAGILVAIVAGLIVGVMVGLLARWLWGKLTKPILAKANQGIG
jgi:hypothetical protein